MCLFTHTGELVSDNLAEVRDLIYGARLQWHNLGLELGLSELTLRVIRANNPQDVDACFREMIYEWLKMANPLPTWEALIAALKKDCIRCEDVAKKVERVCGLLDHSEATVTAISSDAMGNTNYYLKSGAHN